MKMTLNVPHTNRSKGRPVLDSLEILRRKLWCRYVISNSGMSIYKMNSDFDLKWNERRKSEETDEQKKSRNSDAEIKSREIKKTKGGDKLRRKLFERLRDHNVMPFRKHIADFLRLVESHPPLKGSSQIYNSFLWKFLSKGHSSLNETRKLIIAIMKFHNAFNLRRYRPLNKRPVIESDFKSKLHEFPLLTGFIENLQRVCNVITNDLDRVALIGALFREAYFQGDLEKAFYLDMVYTNLVFKLRDSTIVSPGLNEELSEELIQFCMNRKIANDNSVELSYAYILDAYTKKSPGYNLLIDPEDD